MLKTIVKSLYGTDGNSDQVKELILQNERLTVLEIADMLQISFRTIQSILK
jgi:predicted transcriptional regulator